MYHVLSASLACALSGARNRRAALAFVIVTASTLGTVCAEPVARDSGAKLCVLKPGDFRAFGTVVASPTANVNEGPQSAYCVYRGESGATGGVELDVFFPAGEQSSDVEQTFKTTLAESPGAVYSPEGVPGADESQFSLAVPQRGFAPFAANSVRRGDLVFCLSLPASAVAKDELLALSQVALARLAR